MNNCKDPFSHNTSRDVDGRRVCNCEDCISERMNVQAFRANAQRKRMQGKSPNKLANWLSSWVWIDPFGSFLNATVRRGFASKSTHCEVGNHLKGEITNAR